MEAIEEDDDEDQRDTIPRGARRQMQQLEKSTTFGEGSTTQSQRVSSQVPI